MGDKASQPQGPDKAAGRPGKAVDHQLPLHNSVKVALDWQLARHEACRVGWSLAALTRSRQTEVAS